MRSGLTLATAQALPAIARVAQTDGTWTVYEPGDTLPAGLFGGPASTIAQAITKRQLYLALMELGWFGSTMDQINSQINAMLDQLPNPPRERARAEFFTSRDYLRGHALLNAMATSPPLSKTQADLDELFTLGATFAPE